MKLFPMAVFALIALSALAEAQAPSTQASRQSDPQRTQALIVLNAHGATLSNGSLVLEGTMPSAIMFADRPVRAAGHILTSRMVELWSKDGTFTKDPPNATVSVFSKDGSAINDAVVVLRTAKLEGERLSFAATVLQGNLGKADGPASVFIDTVWFGLGTGGFHYLGRNQTTGGLSPNVSDPGTALQGWSNPAPDAPAVQSSPTGNNNSLATPPDLQGGGAKCGAPPLLPCY